MYLTGRRRLLKEHLSQNNIGDEENGDSSEECGGEGVGGRGRGGEEERELCEVKADVKQTGTHWKLANPVEPVKQVLSGKN